MRATVLALVILLGAGGCEASRSPTPRGGTGVVTNAADALLLPTRVAALPALDFGAYERLLYQLRGTPVVVNIWASWCGPCRTEAAALVDAAKRYGEDVQFLGVDIQDEREPAAAFASEYGLTYPSVFDAAGAIHDAMGFVGLPDTVFYRADGSIASTWTGPLTPSALQSHIREILPG
jgi:cytochrome c biogenesis protein CcmG/thiol:disulfide interchange protein DsbE